MLLQVRILSGARVVLEVRLGADELAADGPGGLLPGRERRG
jgi:hypothetical protein